MKPQTIRTLASALLIFSLISVSLATGAGNAAPQKRSVVLTAKIVDENYEPIPGAHVSIFQGEQHLGQGDADARGIVQVEISVNAGGSVELVLEVSKPGMVTKAHKMKLGTSFPTRLAIEEIQLKAGASRTGVVLTVKVVDEKGAPIQRALVNIDLGAWDKGLGVRPPDLQSFTGPTGILQFNIPLRVGQSSTITLEVSREDKTSDVRTIQLSPSSLDRVETVELKPRPENVGDGMPSANIKVKVVDQDGANVEGALVSVSSSAWTPSVASKPHQNRTGFDGSATIAVELMSANSTERFSILVSKPGYKRGQQNSDGVIEIDNKWGRAKNQTFEARPILLVKAPSAIEVKVVVLDGDTKNGVPDAEVVLYGPDYATVNTDTAGVAPLSVEKNGTYKIRVSQDYYWPVKDAEINIKGGVAPPPIEFSLRRKATKDAAKDTIDITVLAKDSIDDKNPRPLRGAAVTDGRGTDYTDDQGQVKLRGAFDSATDITVSATNYKSLTKRVPINKALIGNNTGRATFVLDPATSDDSPIRLVVEVRDAVTRRQLNQANVLLRFKGKIIGSENTDANGEAAFTLRDSVETPLAKLRAGIRVDVRRDSFTGAAEDYKPSLSDITADRLDPSLELKRVVVLMDRDWTALIKAIEALEPKVFAWNKDRQADSNAAFQTFRDMATAAVERAKALENEITTPFVAISSMANGPSLCGQAAPYLIRIPNLAAQVKQKEQELKQKIDRATALAQTCSTLNDPELIRSHYRDAVRLLGEMGKLEKQAVADRNDLLTVAKKNSEVLGVAREARRKFPELPKLQKLAKENLTTALMRAQTQSDVSKTLISRQLTLKDELSVLSVKAFSEVGVPDELRERITVMKGILNSRNKGAQPPELLPKSVEEAPVAIENIQDRVARMIKALENAACPVATLDDVVEGMGTIVFNSGIEIGLAADLPKLAEACAAKAASKTTPPPVKPATTSKTSDPPVTVQNNPPTSIQDNPPADDKTVVDPPTGDKTTNSPNTTNTTNTTKTTQTTAPAQSNNQPPSSGGFWDTAKKSGKNVKDTITNKPTTGGNNTAANRDPNSGNKPNKKPANPPLTVEDIPEDTTTTVAVNKPASGSGGKKPPVVEDIPEDNTTVTSNKPRSGGTPVVEEIPEDNTTIASNKPGSRSGQPPVVEEIPETAPPINSGSDRGSGNSSSGGKEKLPPNVRRDKNGRLVPKDGYEWVNPDDPNDTRVKKKPRDPNKPDFWTLLGGAINQAITGQPPVTNPPGGTTNPPGGGGQRLNLAGTWSVTTQSSGEDDPALQQNWTRTNVWHIWDLGGGRWRVRQVINGQTYDETYSTVDYGGGSFRLITTFMGDTQEASGTYNQSQFQVSSSQGQNRITITGTRQ